MALQQRDGVAQVADRRLKRVDGRWHYQLGVRDCEKFVTSFVSQPLQPPLAWVVRQLRLGTDYIRIEVERAGLTKNPACRISNLGVAGM